MKINNLTVQGFRGFNDKKSMNFHDKLTIILAPNSYGKTSISEAFEWLLYGKTSRVEKADSKEEFKGSYRNIHFPEKSVPFVEITFLKNDNSEVKYCSKLNNSETIKRFVDDKEVKSWPLDYDLSKIPKPFILQHALKYLLLVKPDERFQSFALILGLEELNLFHKDIVSFCTKTDTCIPTDVKTLISNIDNIECRVQRVKSLENIAKEFKKESLNFNNINSAIINECGKVVGSGIANNQIFQKLKEIRENKISKYFKGNLQILEYSKEELKENLEEEKFFFSCISQDTIKKYTDLIALSTFQFILEKAAFFDMGVNFLEKDKKECPFCGQDIDENIVEHIKSNHRNLLKEKKKTEDLQNQKNEVLGIYEKLKSRLNKYNDRQIEKSKAFLNLDLNILEKLKDIFYPDNEKYYKTIKGIYKKNNELVKNIVNSKGDVIDSIETIKKSIEESKEDSKLIKDLGENISAYLSNINLYIKFVMSKNLDSVEADKILQGKLDEKAGTEDISVLIDLVGQLKNIKKKIKILAILNSLKQFRKIIDQYVTSKVLEIISGELTSEVMKWYSQIKTDGDPDVHFSGFDIERTKKGELKARRVQIKARSYDKELVSAVSSLSESKLNALGLCVSIAINFKGDSPFDFLIIDDPIQSWDSEHETQFIEIIRNLIEKGKQVILLSHNAQWIGMVRKGCRTINGRFYEITGYTKKGPELLESPWISWKARLQEVDAILKDNRASIVRLQQAEEEIRLAICDITSDIFYNKKKIIKNPGNFNSTIVRKLLIECGVNSNLIDRIYQTFETTDESHHPSISYTTQRQRIKKYHGWCHELAQYLEK